jgi:hypothetical protein
MFTRKEVIAADRETGGYGALLSRTVTTWPGSCRTAAITQGATAGLRRALSRPDRHYRDGASQRWPLAPLLLLRGGQDPFVTPETR